MDYSKFSNEELEAMMKEAQHMADIKNTEQMTKKIMINSLYGGMAAKHFSLYNNSMARAITGTGRFFIKLLANNIEEKLQKMMPSPNPYIIAGDTDSVYFQIEGFVEKYVNDKTITEKTKWCDAFYQKVIEPVVQDTIKFFGYRMNSFDLSWVGAEREIIADAGIFVAKKKYAARVRNLEGKEYPEDAPYMKIQGLEIIQGGTSPFAKKYLKEAIPVILDKDTQGIKDWFNDTKSDFLNWPIEDIARTQGVSKVENPNWGKVIEGRKVSVPFGSRVCVVTNNYITKHNLMETFSLVQAGDKVKILFLEQPNPLRSEAFGFLDPRFAIDFKKYVDYDTTFEKYFVSPLQGMLDAIGINLKNQTQELDEW